MEWTKEMPTKEGWYWRRYKGGEPHIVALSAVCGEVFVSFAGTDEVGNEDVGGEWYGPLEPPE